MNKSALPLVIVSHALPDGWLDLLQDKCQLVIGPEESEGLTPELENWLPETQGLFSLLTLKVDDKLLSRAPNLKVVSNMAVGFDNIDINSCTKRGLPVGHTPGVLTDGTADLTMAIMLAAARRITEASQDARQGRWKTWSPTGWLGMDFRDATLGIVGMGQIGSGVAERALGFGMKILFTDSNLKHDLADRFNAKQVPLETLLKSSDIVTLHVPLTGETHHLINEERLKSMKSNALLVNTSRGLIVDSNALVSALENKWIAAAALDVTDPEPLPTDHPLFGLSNCLIVPHIGSATWNTRRKMAERACENLIAGLHEQRLPYCANPEVYNA